jgi:diguanylate cyclase (GGDEF)-like protein
MIPLDLNIYVRQPGAWISVIVVFVIIASAIAISTGTMLDSVHSLLHELELKNQEIAKYAETDYLTGALNRRGLDNRLTAMISKQTRDGGIIYVYYIDLDGFKQINDNYDHIAGDFALTNVSSTIKSLIRPEDLFARVGGDEFVVVMHVDNTKKLEIIAIIERMLTKIAKPFEFNHNTLFLSASIGVVEHKPTYISNKITVDSLIKLADATMFTVKKSGKNNFLVSSSTEIYRNS